MIISKDEFLTKESQRAHKLFTAKHKSGFPSREAFANWFREQLVKQDFKCHYCETSIFDIQSLIEHKRLFPRKTGYGERGRILEVDKMTNHLGYSAMNCVLSCYYCNNDKSYTLDSVTYKKFFGPARKAFFLHLMSDTSHESSLFAHHNIQRPS